MEIFKNGKFSHVIHGTKLSRGLRDNKRKTRNNDMMIECAGAVGRDNVLQVIEELERLDTSIITDGFPYPQIFVFNQVIIVCGQTEIYELVAGELVLKITVPAGSTWRALDFYQAIYMSNGVVTVLRDPNLRLWGIDENNLPIGTALCNYNGQIIIGAPDVEITDE